MKKILLLVLFISGFVQAQIVNIPDVNFKNKLIQLGFDTNSDGNIQQSEALSVEGLFISNSNISDLTGIQSFTNLVLIDCSYNQLTQLNVSGLTHLISLYCYDNQISYLNITNCSNLSIFDCDNNLLTSLDFTGVTSLSTFHCMNNSITNFNFTNLVIFNEFLANNNQISNLDLSMVNITGLGDFSYNPLQTINIKNGFSENLLFNFYFSPPNPTLQFICADDNELVNVNNYLASYGLTNVLVNSYCSFIPGGNYNTITGIVKYDGDANGCDTSDLPKPDIRININDGVNQGAMFTNNMGNYYFYTQAGTFTLTPNIENTSWFTFSPASASIFFANANNNITTQDFCITANGVHPDIEVVIAPVIPARPGFDATYTIVYKNKGNQTLSGNVTLTFDDDRTDFVSSNPNPDNLNLNSLLWNYTNLLPFESRVIYLTLNVNSPVDTPSVNIGDVLNFTTIISAITGDEIPLDNTFTYNQTVIGAYDPNTIACLEGDIVPDTYIGQYLHYGVNFENTGNYPAENVVVKIEIDVTKYDMNTLQLLNTSHNSYTKITGNVIEFIFQNIQLDTGGHGNILFKIKINPSLVNGDVVSKRADIFFDYNAPIDTGMATTTFETLSTSVLELDNSISVYPNPTNSILNVNSNFNIKSIALYDVQGRLLQTQLTEASATTLDISNQTSGVYFVKITTEAGSKVERIIRE